MPARTKRSRINDPANTRSRILDAAARLFQQKGYGETSMHDITRAAFVSSGALHHHYRTKKKLGVAVIRERVAKAVEEVWIEPVLEAGDPVAGVTNAFEGIIRGLGKRIAGCPLNNLAIELSYAEPEFRKEIQAVFRRWQESLADHIAQSGADFSEEGISPSEMAAFIIASYSGAMTMAKAAQSPDPLTIALKVLTQRWPEQRVAA